MSRGPEDPGAWFWWPGCSERRGRLPVLPGRGARSASAFDPSPGGSAQLSHCGGGSFHARDFSLVHCPDGGAFERHRDTHTAVLRQPVLGSWEMWAPCLLSVCWTPWNGILRHSPRLGLGRDRGRTPVDSAVPCDQCCEGSASSRTPCGAGTSPAVSLPCPRGSGVPRQCQSVCEWPWGQPDSAVSALPEPSVDPFRRTGLCPPERQQEARGTLGAWAQGRGSG